MHQTCSLGANRDNLSGKVNGDARRFAGSKIPPQSSDAICESVTRLTIGTIIKQTLFQRYNLVRYHKVSSPRAPERVVIATYVGSSVLFEHDDH